MRIARKDKAWKLMAALLLMFLLLETLLGRKMARGGKS